MERTGECVRLAAGLARHAHAAMATGIQEGAKAAIAAADREHRNAEVVHGEIAARLGQVSGQSDQLRMTAEHLAPFAAGDIRVVIAVRCHAHLHARVDVFLRVDLAQEFGEDLDLLLVSHGAVSGSGSAAGVNECPPAGVVHVVSSAMYRERFGAAKSLRTIGSKSEIGALLKSGSKAA